MANNVYVNAAQSNIARMAELCAKLAQIDDSVAAYNGPVDVQLAEAQIVALLKLLRVQFDNAANNLVKYCDDVGAAAHTAMQSSTIKVAYTDLLNT